MIIIHNDKETLPPKIFRFFWLLSSLWKIINVGSIKWVKVAVVLYNVGLSTAICSRQSRLLVSDDVFQAVPRVQC